MAAPSLMTLPFEIRGMIIREAITLHRAPPSSPSASIDRQRLYIPTVALYAERSPDETPARAQVALLGTSRQLRSDTRHVLAGLRSEAHVLDLMVVLGRGLLPTWCHVPGLQKTIKLVVVSVRIFDPTPDLPAEWEKFASRSPVSATESIQILMAQHIPRTCRYGHAASAAAVFPIPAVKTAMAGRCEWAAIYRLRVVVEKPRSLPARQTGLWGANLLARGPEKSRTRLAEGVAKAMHNMICNVVRERTGVNKRHLMANVWKVEVRTRGGPVRVFRVGKLFREHYRPGEIDVLPATSPPGRYAKLAGRRGWNHRSVERWRRKGLWRERVPDEGGEDGGRDGTVEALVGSTTGAPDA